MPSKVIEAGEPNISGCNDGGGLHESPLTQAVGGSPVLAQGTLVEHTWAS